MSGLSSAGTFLKRDISYFLGLLSTASFLTGQFIIPVSSQKPFSSVFLCSARNAPILMLLIHTPDVCMLLYVDTYSAQKCGVFINLIQNVHTGRPLDALPPSTHIIALLYSVIFRLYRTLCKFQRTSVDDAIGRCCFLFCYCLSCRPVPAAFLTPNSLFFDDGRASISYWHFS